MMAHIDLTKEKLHLDYPCKWAYRLIAKSETDVRNAVKRALENQEYELTPSKSSSSGKYFSMKLEVTVMDEEDRQNIFRKFQQDTDIVMVL